MTTFRQLTVVNIVPFSTLAIKAPNTTITEFAKTVDPDETAHNKLSHLELHSLPSHGS